MYTGRQSLVKNNNFFLFSCPFFCRTVYKKAVSYYIRTTFSLSFVFLFLKFIYSKKGQKNWQNLHYLTLCSICQIDGENFINLCGLLRKHELYKTEIKFIFAIFFLFIQPFFFFLQYRNQNSQGYDARKSLVLCFCHRCHIKFRGNWQRSTRSPRKE